MQLMKGFPDRRVPVESVGEAAVRAYGQLLEADPVSADFSAAAAAAAAEPITEALEDHLEEAQRQQDQLADLLSTDPAERPEGWQLRGEILAHVDRLRSELEPGRLPDISVLARAKPLLWALRDRARNDMHWSDRAASSLVSVVSPKLPNLFRDGRAQAGPRIIRPPVSRSRVVTSLASLGTRRRATGVTIAPSRMVRVASAAAVSSTHGSAIARRSSFRWVT